MSEKVNGSNINFLQSAPFQNTTTTWSGGTPPPIDNNEGGDNNGDDDEYGMCEECRNKLKSEASMMLMILSTPAASEDTKKLADDILYGMLYELYCIEDTGVD